MEEEKISPPKNALRFLEWFCPPGLYEGIEGDLLEQFDKDVAHLGIKKAQQNFNRNTLKFFKPGIILRNSFSFQIINTIMWRSYFKITYRNILKNKGYSFINIFGLSLGIASCLLILSYVRFELSYDDFQPEKDRTYRVDQALAWKPEAGKSGSSAPPLANAIKTNYPEVEDAMRINTPGDFLVRFSDGANHVSSFNETHVFAADSNFFSFFGFKLKEGNPATALTGVNKVVVSEETAKKLFGDAPALGKILQFGDERKAVEVTGVTEHQPANTHFHFDYLLSMETNPNVKRRDWSWVWTQVVTYVRLKPQADAQSLETKMASFSEKVIKPAFAASGMDYENAFKGKGWTFYLTPITDIHLKSGDNRLGPVGSIQYVYTFSVIGIFVLLIAAINFVNLSTARGTKRAKEVGVKKAIGALRSSLITQFQSESVLLTLFSTLVALVVAEGLRFAIVEIAGIDIPLWKEMEIIWLLPLVSLMIGFIAGLYPSFYLTAFKPVQVLKGKIASGMGNTSLRNSLVLVQFAISIALIIGTIIVFQQLKFVNSTNLGFNKENVLLIKNAEKMGSHLEAFRNELESYPGVTQVGIAMELPGGGNWSDDFVREGTNVNVSVALVKIDEDYFKMLDFELIAGRGFEKERPSDKNAIIPNEITVRLFGWKPEEAIGQYIVYPGNDNTRHQIIGVMKDSHYQSLHQNITPMFFAKVDSDLWGDWETLVVKFKATEISALLKKIETNWNKVLNDNPLRYSFLDQELAKQYQLEERLGGLFGIFSGLSILIAIVGLVGLVSYTTEIRKKEIGIRKVFGASTVRIVMMMNSQYIKLILVSLLVAVPLSWWAISQWLATFAYRVEINPFTFAIAAFIEIVIAVVSVGYLSLKAATLNPSDVLKEE
jgi:putative ABC transport system permease protein